MEKKWFIQVSEKDTTGSNLKKKTLWMQDLMGDHILSRGPECKKTSSTLVKVGVLNFILNTVSSTLRDSYVF